MKKHIILIIIIGFVFSLGSEAQTRIRVNNTPGVDADYSDLQEAINNAGQGDVIYIESSGIPYTGNYHVDEPWLTLIGPGYLLSLNDSTQANKAPAIVEHLYVDATATGSTIMGLQIEEVIVNAGSVKVTRNHIYRVSIAESNSATDLSLFCNYITCMVNAGNSNTSSASIYNNIFKTGTKAIQGQNNASFSIYNNVFDVNYGGVLLDIENANIYNNIIFNTYPNYNSFIDANPALNNSVAYNVICQQELPEFPNNVWNVAIEDAIVYTTGGPEKKYILPAGSPAIGAGENGADCGIFGGNTPYVFSGLPPIPHIFEAEIPNSGSASEGLPIHIKAKTQP
ncbi:MAG: hypothetical protein ACLFPE_11180 [Bacteroidales bacterium]